MDYRSGTTGCIWRINSGIIFFFFCIIAKLTHIFSHVYLNFPQVLHVVNSLENSVQKHLFSTRKKWGIKSKTGCKAGTTAKGRFIKLANNSTYEISLRQGQGYAMCPAHE